MMRLLSAGTFCLGMLAAAGLSSHVRAEETFSLGKETWRVDPQGTLSTPDWPLQSALKMTLNSEPGDPPKKGQRNPPSGSSTPVPELKYASDHKVQYFGLFEDDKSVSYLIERSLVFDTQRRAVRVLDVITNTGQSHQKVNLSYATRWQPDIVPQLAKPREFTIGNATSSCGALVTVTGDSKLPILMFLFGAQDKGWKRTVSATSDSLRWEYSGALAAGQHVLLLHWITLTEDVKTETLRQARAGLIQEGMPVDDSLNTQVRKDLANFPMAIEAQPASNAASTGRELHLLKALCQQLKVDPLPDRDQILLGDGTALKGNFKVSELRLNIRAQDRTLTLDEVAALQGGGGIGRRPRVYLRDGTVATGSLLTWKEASLEDATLGTVTLHPDNLDTLILRSRVDDLPPTNFAALWMNSGGDVTGVSELPQGAAQIRWQGGVLQIPWDQIVKLRQLPLPALGQEVTLKSGSRIHGWISSLPAGPDLASPTAYAVTWKNLMAALSNEPAPPPKEVPRLRTIDDSWLIGGWSGRQVALSTPTGVIEVPVEEIRRLHAETREDTGSALLEITTTSGSTLKGNPVAASLSWRHGDQTLDIPWLLISEIVASEPTAPQP